jgi:transcriptional regulator GlxA family with amidase domain
LLVLRSETSVQSSILAEAGLLYGKPATTHWLFARDLPDRFPEIKVEEDRIFIVGGSVWTSARISAGLDLALGMIENAW